MTLFRSIRVRLTVWYIAVLAVFIVAFAVAIYFSVLRSLDRDINSRLLSVASAYLTSVKAEQREQETDDTGESSITEAINAFRFRDYQLVVTTIDDRLVGKSSESFADDRVFAANDGFSNIPFRDAPSRVFRDDFDIGSHRYKLLIIYSLKESQEIRTRLGIIFAIGVLATLLFAGIGGYLLARKSLAPVSEMSRQAANIGETNLDERLLIRNRHDELGKLAGVINGLLERLSLAFEQQRQFMADASHELRTPLAVVRGESEVSLSKRDRSAEEYIESLTVVNEESIRLSHIVEDLFTLSRADSGQLRPLLEPVYLDEIVSDSVRSMQVLANERGIKIDLAENDPAQIEGNAVLLHRLFANLLHNAIKFSPKNSVVLVRSLASDEALMVTIEDNGPGIPAEDSENIFQRFYRVDKARSRESVNGAGGSGLGLAIAKWIADLHNAVLVLSKCGPGGSTFTVTFQKSES